MALLPRPRPEGAMRHRQYTVTGRDVHDRAMSLLTTYLRLPDFSRRCPAPSVLSVVLLAAARLGSVFAAAGLRPAYLLLDRGFCAVDVIRYLQAGRYPFVMPLPVRGRRIDHPGGPSGSRVFAYARRSTWGQYTLTNARGRRATVRVCERCS